MRYLGIDVCAHLPQGKDGRRSTSRSKGKVERPFRTVKEMHETLYHFHEPRDEEEANAWLMNFLIRYNAMEHRSQPHSRMEDWLANLPSSGVRAVCSWERFCTFAREPERRKVGGDARVSVDGVNYEVDPDLAGETVILWWGIFDNITIGYWRNPTATAEALRNGWFHTGDIATIDEDGYYRIVDRKKDMINSGGCKVWPREVEEVLFKHPAVREAAVVAMPDAYWGERPVAYIALKEGQTATQEELIAYCKENLANYEAPSLIKFRDELPKLPTGKVLRRVLREEARQLTPAS
jgi:acyl-CoA synthetase (AMP-forming)/AMP-acid ligase II